jgi:TolB-like protein/class 3 adenylate cyclase/Flp pilus assembly protein TadD
MPAEASDPKFEVGHVLFIDIVGFSKLLINQQSDLLQKLKEIVQGTEQFRLAEAEGTLLRLPAGDGGALVFRKNPEAPVLCALEIGRALKGHPELPVRIGVHSGPVNEVADLSDRTNVAGAGVNIAQRVMGCGDAGHILLSKHVVDDLEHYARWRPNLHDLGECEVKHGLRLHLFSLYDGSAGNPQTPAKFSAEIISQSTRRNWSIAIAVLALALVVYGAFHFLSIRNLNPIAPNVSPVTNKSIAVLPFDNLSRDPDNAYFTEGIQEEILTRIAKIADLKVISRTSTQRFKSSPDNLPQIAKQLGVANILEGGVQKSADQVRVSVQLINAATDAHLWAESYDRSLTDIFQVESEIAKKVADTLQAKLTGDEQHALALRPTENPEAHQFYLKGRYQWNKRTEEGFKKAIEYFDQAIAADPTYALAYAGVADCYSLLGFHGWGIMAPKEAFPKAKAAAAKALEIDRNLAEAHVSLAYVQQNYDWDFAGAESEFKRALELSPNYATAHQWYALHLVVAEKYAEAIAEMKQAQELDPLSLIISTNVAWAFYFAREYDQMIEECQKGLELDPNFAGSHWILGQGYRQKGMYDEAIAEFQKAIDLSERDPVRVAVLGHAYAVAGKREEALKIINELTERSKQRYFPPYFIALIYTGLNANDEAFAWLEKAFAERSAGLIFLKAEPMFDPIRSDPRFQDLLRRAGLTP